MTDKLSKLAPFGLIGLFLCQLFFVHAYLGAERVLHFWDFAMYADMAVQLWNLPSFSALWEAFSFSFSQNYNLLYTLPSLFFFSFGEQSRTIFILANFCFFFVAHQLAIGFLIKKIFDIPFLKAALWGSFLSCFTPLMWVPLLEGYPDNGAAAFLTLATALLVRHRFSLKNAILAGFSCGIAIVLRRHFAYPVIALYLSYALFSLKTFYDVRMGRNEEDTLSLWNIGLFSLCLLGGLLGSLALIEPSYLREMVSTDFNALYASYARPTSYVSLFILSRMGVGLFLFSCTGFFIAATGFEKSFPRMTFLLILTFLWGTLWATIPAQTGDHYLVAILPAFCLIGLYAFLNWLAGFSYRTLSLGFVLLALTANSAYALWLAPDYVLPSDMPRSKIYSAPHPPWKRTDMDELNHLAEHIKKTQTPTDRYAVVGSSFIWNQDLFFKLMLKNGWGTSPFYPIEMAPESDGQQPPPLQAFTAANVYLVAEPTQYHLDPVGQKVVTAFASRFPPDPDSTYLFEKEPQQFILDQGVIISIWRRKGWVPQTLNQNLNDLRSFKDSLVNWLYLSTDGAATITMLDQDGKLYDLSVGHPAGTRQTIFFYDKLLDPDLYRFVLDMASSPNCEKIQLGLEVRDEDGKLIYEQSFESFPQQRLFYLPVDLSKRLKRSYVFLKIQTVSTTGCSVALKQLHQER